jgi:RimJ/RimL family protein N-acetyltransferase
VIKERYMHPRSPEDISETETFINQSIADLHNSNNLVLVILKKESQEFLGCAGLHGIKRKHPELGIWLKQAAHGHKYGLEAITAIKNWAIENLDYEYLLYPVDRVNIASRKIPERLGGKIFREYNKTNMSGNILHIVEYRIYKN